MRALTELDWHAISTAIERAPGLSGRYRPIRLVGQGATGVLAQLEELTLGAPRAIKILKPGLGDMVSPDGKTRRSLASYFTQEVEHLRDVSHENVVKVYERGMLPWGLPTPDQPGAENSASTPYYIMDYIDGKSLTAWVEGRGCALSRDTIVSLLAQVVTGLAAVHRHQVLHGDVKPDNILVDSAGTVKLTDFGFAKSLLPDRRGDTFWCQDKRYLHPELKDRLLRSRWQQPSDTGRSLIPVTVEEIRERGVIWELHALGRTVEELLDLILRADPARQLLTRNDTRFLKTVTARLVESRTLGPWSIPDWSDRYRSVEALAADVQKLLPGRSLAGEVPEYDAYHEDMLRIPLCERVPLSTRLRPIIDHPLFQRLGHCTQLGVTHLVFRGGRHTRYEHSLGVMFHAIEYARALWVAPTDQYFREAAGARELQALLLAALLHDLGQYPFAHAFEESELEGQPLFRHEALTAALLSASDIEELETKLGQPGLFSEGSAARAVRALFFDADGRPLSYYLQGPHWVASVADVLSVLDTKQSTSLVSPVRDILHDIVDGPIDADKMDYLRRDALHLDIRPGSAVDLTQFLKSLTTIPGTERIDADTMRQSRRLALDFRGIASAEDLLMARYHMFTEVYWNRVVRSAERMLRHAVDGIHDLMQEERFRQVFLPEVLASDDQHLLRRLLTIAIELGESAATTSQREHANGLAECLKRVLARQLHREALELDAEYDGATYEKLSNLWSRALSNADARNKYGVFRQQFLDEVAKMTGETWRDWELLIDIPDPRSERPEKYRFGVLLRDGTAVPVTERSSIWRNFLGDFRIHARHIRVFVSKDRYSKATQETFAGQLREALVEALGKVPRNLLEPLAERDAPK